MGELVTVKAQEEMAQAAQEQNDPEFITWGEVHGSDITLPTFSEAVGVTSGVTCIQVHYVEAPYKPQKLLIRRDSEEDVCWFAVFYPNLGAKVGCMNVDDLVGVIDRMGRGKLRSRMDALVSREEYFTQYGWWIPELVEWNELDQHIPSLMPISSDEVI